LSSDLIRIADPQDAEAILRIYGPAVRETAASFEMEVPGIDAMAARISTVLERYPWLVFQTDSHILGYAYAGPHRSRAAYQWSVEVSVYVEETARRAGVARALYRKLVQVLTGQGYVNAFAVIALPNPPSVALHESFGFSRIGVCRNAGYKLGRWHDVGFWQLELQHPPTPPVPPAPPKSFHL